MGACKKRYWTGDGFGAFSYGCVFFFADTTFVHCFEKGHFNKALGHLGVASCALAFLKLQQATKLIKFPCMVKPS